MIYTLSCRLDRLLPPDHPFELEGVTATAMFESPALLDWLAERWPCVLAVTHDGWIRPYRGEIVDDTDGTASSGWALRSDEQCTPLEEHMAQLLAKK